MNMCERIKIIENKKDYFNANVGVLDKYILDKYELDFDIRYAHESTKIEGNTLSLLENKLIIEDQISVGGKSLREIYEVINHDKAFKFVKNNIKEGITLSSNVVKNIHQILMDNIISGGLYRNEDVIITGASHKPPSRTEMHDRLKEFYYDLESSVKHPLEKAAWVHAEFVAIHPFIDGNGRTSRIIMNYILMENGYLPINIPSKDKRRYYNALDMYGVDNNLEEFTKIVLDLEENQLDVYSDLIKFKKDPH